MLILSRLEDEEIVIDVDPASQVTQVRVKIIDIRGHRVRIGLSAYPDDYRPDGQPCVRFDRDEIWLTKQEANRGA